MKKFLLSRLGGTGWRNWLPGTGAAVMLTPLTVLAQPTITGLAPSRHAPAASRTTDVTLTFSQSINPATAGNVRVLGSLTGRRAGTTGTAGAVVGFNPAQNFRAGEVVSVTVPASVQSTGGQAAATHVYQFRAAAGPGPGAFGGTTDAGSGQQPIAIAAADVNLDGHMDLLVSNYDDAAVRAFLGNGSGSFTGGASVSVGFGPIHLAVGDLNGDGAPDLGVVNINASSATVRLNNGSGAFSGGATISVGASPRALTFGDIDADGDLDLLASNYGANTVSVRFNNGSGAFSGAQNVSVGSQPQGLDLADVDNDGDLDLLAANTFFAAQSVSLRLNDGTGSFTGTTDIPVGLAPARVTAADVDSDGDADLLSLSENGDASVRINTGGTFGGGSLITLPAHGRGMVAADVEGDGDLDLLTSHLFVNQVQVRLNDGTGSFSGTGSVGVGSQPAGLAVADFDGDQDLDLATPNAGANTYSVRLNEVADLVVSSVATVPGGTYNNVTVTATGAATLAGGITVLGTLTVQGGGVLDDGCQVITGAGSFAVEAGATLRVCHPQGLAATGATGAVQVTGGRTFSADAAYVFDGTAAQSTGPGLPATVRNLEADNPDGVSLAHDVVVRRELRLPGAGNLALAGHSLTLASDAAGTAMLINGGSGRVLGSTAIVERYLDPALAPGPGYRHLASPVQAATVGDLATAGFTPLVNPAYNTTPNLPAGQFPNVFGFDESRQPASPLFVAGYYSPASLSSILTPGRGWSVYVGGGRVPDFVGSLTQDDVTLTGLTRTGTATGPQQKSGWHLLGNPFPAPLDWDQVLPPAGMSGSISVYRSTGGANGAYRTRVNGMGSLPDGVIGTGQAFFARVTGPGPVSLTLPTAARLTTYDHVPVYRGAADTRPVLSLTLAAVTAPVPEADEAVVYFEAGATAGLDERYDGLRPARNVGLPTLVTLAGPGEELAVNGLPESLLTHGATIELLADLPHAGTYALRVGQWAHLTRADAVLLDRLTTTRYDLATRPTVLFNAARAGELRGRFALLVGRGGSLTGLLPERVAGRLLAWPNPAGAETRVRVELPDGCTALEVIDATGRMVRHLKPAPADSSVELHGLQAGVYVVRAGAATQRLVVE